MRRTAILLLKSPHSFLHQKSKKLTGGVQIAYQDDQAIKSITGLNVRLVNLLPTRSYLEFSTPGRSTPITESELSNFFIFYYSKKLDISTGDFTAGNDSLHSAAQAANSKNSYFTSRYNFTKDQSLELRYSLANGEDLTTGTSSSQNESVRLTYNNRF